MKAMLLLDPERADAQRSFVAERTRILAEIGDGLWVDIDDGQAERFAAEGIAVQPYDGLEQVVLPAVAFDPAAGEPRVAPALAAPDTPYRIVQFVAPLEPEWLQAIEADGGVLLGDLPGHAVLARLSPAQIDTLRKRPELAWTGPYHPAYAMAYELAGRAEPFGAADLAGAEAFPALLEPQPAGALRVRFFADVPHAEAAAALAAAGATVVDDNGHSLIINPPAAGLAALLRVPGVRTVEVQREVGTANQRAGVILGVNQVRNFGNVDFLVNLDGSGEIVGIFDTGLDNGSIPTAHTDFNGPAGSRVLALNSLNPAALGNGTDSDGHGTHVTGTIAGNGGTAPAPTPLNPTASVPRGVAPACSVMMTSARDVPVGTPPAGYLENWNTALQAIQNHYAAGARVHNNSWRNHGLHNAYTANASAFDRLAWLQPDDLILFAAGNEEGDRNNTGVLDQNRLGQESCAKNVLTIGATENVTSLDGDARNYQTRTSPCNRYGTNAGSPVQQAANQAAAFTISDNPQEMAMFSSRGRVQNPARPAHRRVKPDLVAPGTNVLSTLPNGMALAATIPQFCPPLAAVPNPSLAATAPAAAYRLLSGTSMATPLATGSAALVRQFYRQRFGQLRRPALVQALPQFVDSPAAVLQGGRRVVAWVERDAGAGRHDIRAAVYDAEAAPQGAIVTLARDVGAQPAPALALHGTTTLLLWRDGAGALKLAAFDAAWAPLAGFGTAGVATVNAAVRTEADRKPALCVLGDAVGIGWVKAGSDDLQFQRWHPGSGTAIDANPVLLGAATQCGPHGWLQHDGTQWAAFWAGPVGAQQRVQMRRIGANGTPDASVRTIVSQAAALGAPHAVHDPARAMWLVAWHSTDAAQRGILTRRLDATGTALGVTAERPVPLTVDGRSPRLDLHPDGGFVLGWEDAGGGSFDVYVGFLNADGTAGPVSRLQVSDSPRPTAGFTMVVDAHGVVPVWQSDDETDSNVLGLYLLGITKQGVFAAQADPATPLLENQTYVRQTLATQPETDRVAVAMCWGGGDWYLLRHTGSTFISDLELVHTSADGVPDAAFGAGGARRLERAFSFEALSLAWRGNLLAASSSHGPENTVYLARTDGRLVDSFGRHGLLKLNEAAAAPVYGQVALQGTGASLQLLVAFGRHDPAGSHEIRWTVRNRTGAADVAPRTLARAAGTAKQGWCHWLASETPRHLVAAWHAPAGAPPALQVLVQRFTLAGAPQTGQPTPFVLTALPGEAINATIAPRPVQFQPAFPVSAADLAASRQREFGAAWQHQSPGGRWEIRFSCLQRSGQPVATAGQFDVAVVASATDHATEPQIVWHGNGYGLAWLQRPAAGGNAVLMFTVLNPLGQRPNLAPIGPAAPAADFAVTAAGVDVQRFHLVWGGAAFRITWTEVDGGQLLHRQRGLSVPQPASGARYDAPFQQPSAALLKATLINGATNLRNTALPNIGNNVHDGYGWGRVNLRQSLSPAQPVSFHVRDDGCVAAGRRVRYALRIRRGTQLLRITMAWTDPPGVDLVNHLHLRVTTPPFPACGARVFHGNRFGSAAGTQHLSRAVTAPEPPFEDTHTVQQVVLAAPPALPEGDYLVEVICSQLPGGAFDRFPGQPFALVCVGSGPELRTAANAPAAPIGVY